MEPASSRTPCGVLNPLSHSGNSMTDMFSNSSLEELLSKYQISVRAETTLRAKCKCNAGEVRVPVAPSPFSTAPTPSASTQLFLSFFLFSFSVFFCLFRSAPAAYGGSQARGRIGAVAAGLHHRHSNTRSQPCLQPTPQLMAMPILDLLSEARDQTRNLMIPSWIRFRCAMMGTPACTQL